MAESHREEIAKLETLYANNPEGRVFTHLAEAYRKAGELQRAREIVEDGLRRHAEYSSAHVVLGRVLMDLGETDGARGAFERVLELDAHNLIALRSLGEIAVAAGRPSEALPYYRELVSLDPADDRLRLTVTRLEDQAATSTPVEEVPAEAPDGSENESPAEATIEAEEPTAIEDAVDADASTGELVEAAAEAPDADAETGPAAPLSWEDDVGVPLEALPGDLAAFEGSGSAEAEEGVPPDEDRAAIDIGAWSLSEDVEEDEADIEATDADVEPEDQESDDWVSATDWDRIARSADLSSPDDDAPAADEDGGAFATAEDVPERPDATGNQDAGALAWEDTEDDEEEAAASDEGWTWPAETRDVDAAWAESADGEARRREDADDDLFIPGADVMTETMAELYTAQGFHARAADVYRSLLSERPGDERLEARLREAEAAAQPARPADAAPPDGEDEEEHERWLQGVESAWTGGGGTAMAEETPYAWAERPGADEAEGGAPISSYFRELLAWRPSATAVRTEDETDNVPVLEVESAGGDGQEWDMPLLLEEEIVEEDASSDVPSDGGGVPSGPTSASDVEEAFDEWFGPRAGEPTPEATVEEPREADTPESDEDLEMFRSWLQSLKK